MCSVYYLEIQLLSLNHFICYIRPYKVVVNKIWNLRHLDAKLLNTFSMCLNFRGLQEMAEQGHIDSALLMANLVRIATTQKEDIYEKVHIILI